LKNLVVRRPRRACPTFKSPRMAALDYSWSMTSTLRVAVLGVGSLGKEHARVYSELAAVGTVEFAGVHDIQSDTAQRIAEKYRVKTFASAAEAAAGSDALSIVTPTTTHFEAAKALLKQGKHLLVEKPMTEN